MAKKDGTCKGGTKICSLAKDGRKKKVAKLSSDPSWICGKCLRVAACAEHLCKPEKL